MKRLKEKCHVSYGSKDNGTYHVIKPDGKKRKFVESESGLYHLDATKENEFTLVTTVEDKANQYTKKE
jgi:hypothetical protein